MSEIRTTLLSGSGGVWPAVSRLSGGPRLAAIAFLGAGAPFLLPQFRGGDTIVCDASDRAIKSGATSLDALLELSRRNVLLYHHPNLHAKVVSVGNTAVIGSMNASQTSASLDEAALVSSDPRIVKDARSFVRRLVSEGIAIDEVFLRRIRRLPARKAGTGGPPDRGSAPPVRVLQFARLHQPAYVARAIDARVASTPRETGFVLSASWSQPNEGPDRTRRPSDLVLWIDRGSGSDPSIEISRIVDREHLGSRWVYYEIVPVKYKPVRLSKVKQILASRGFRGDLASLGNRTQTIRLEGLEEDLRAVFGSTFPPIL